MTSSASPRNQNLPSLTLYYFDFGGKAEPIRLALHYLGIPFIDHRFSDRDEFLRLKASGELPFGQVPALKVSYSPSVKEVILTQSAAILRFVACLGGIVEVSINDQYLKFRSRNK